MKKGGLMNIDSLLVQRQNGKGRDRRVWGIPLEGIWLPFFLATNTEGKTAISPEALGAPLRLAKNADGSVKFSKTGRPIFRVAPEIGNQVRIIRENFTAQLSAYAERVIGQKPEEYKAEVAKAQKAGRPILEADAKALDEAIEAEKARQLAEAVAEATGQKAERPKAKAKEPAMAGVTG
jgi:hypothetical protein